MILWEMDWLCLRQVHRGLCEEEKNRLFCALNLGKLSTATRKHLARNSNFPSGQTGTALFSRQSKAQKLHSTSTQTQGLAESRLCDGFYEEAEKIILYTENIDFAAENEKLRTNMPWRVVELDKVSQKMLTQMAKASKLRSSNPKKARSLPRLSRLDINFGL